MRFNWNAVIAAVGYLTDEPEANDTLTGKGYSVTRAGAGKFTIELEQVEFPEEAAEVAATPAPEPTPEVPNPVPADASEGVDTSVTPPPAAAEATPEAPSGGEVPTDTGTPPADSGATATGQ